MAIEIERRFLVAPGTNPQELPGWRRSYVIKQGYVMLDPDRGGCLRVRLTDNHTDGTDSEAFVTVKFKDTEIDHSAMNEEFEWEVPRLEGFNLFTHSLKIVIKTRHLIKPDGHRWWEVDVFEGPWAGLIIAEYELPSERHPCHPPEWCGEEITGQHQWSNEQLAVKSVDWHTKKFTAKQ